MFIASEYGPCHAVGSPRLFRVVTGSTAPGLRAAAIAAVAIVAACQATAPATPPTSTLVTGTAPSAGSTPVPPATSATSAPSADTTAPAAREIGGILGVVPPGTYTRRGFEPRVTFEVDGPWRSVQALDGFFDIQQQVGSPDVIAVQFAKPVAIHGPNAVSEATTADAAVAAIRQNEDSVVVESSDSLIDGLAGRQITVENPATETADHSVLQLPAGPLRISPARRLWMAFFDTPDGLLAILVGGSVAKWDEALTTAEPVLESITIGD